MKRSLWLTILCLISICTISHAQISLKTYQQMPAADVRKNETFQAYINELGRGYEWANTALEHKKQAKLFCVPGTLGLRAENYIDILDAQIKWLGKTDLSDMVIELLLLQGLIRTFPCPQATSEGSNCLKSQAQDCIA